MAWREHSMREERGEFVQLALRPGANKSELSRRFGVSRSNGYKWLQRYVAEGEAGLAERFLQMGDGLLVIALLDIDANNISGSFWLQINLA